MYLQKVFSIFRNRKVDHTLELKIMLLFFPSHTAKVFCKHAGLHGGGSATFCDRDCCWGCPLKIFFHPGTRSRGMQLPLSVQGLPWGGSTAIALCIPSSELVRSHQEAPKPARLAVQGLEARVDPWAQPSRYLLIYCGKRESSASQQAISYSYF